MSSTHDLVFETTDSAADKVGDFERALKLAHSAVFANAPQELQQTRTVAILAADFVAEVERTQDAMLPKKERTHRFGIQRYGGEVHAKTMSMNPESSEVRIVFNEAQWLIGNDLCFIFNFRTAIHEMVHALVYRLRWQSGVIENVNFLPQTPSEQARSMVCGAAEEFLADRIAGRAIGAFGTANKGGRMRPLNPTDLHDVTYREELAKSLGQYVYPKLPEEVNSYRGFGQSLDRMWATVLRNTDQTFKLLAHCEAETDFLGRPGPLEDECADHPASAIYLREAWSEICKPMKERFSLSNLEAFKNEELRILEAGEGALIKMWNKLGLTFEERPDRTFSIWVSDPKR